MRVKFDIIIKPHGTRSTTEVETEGFSLHGELQDDGESYNGIIGLLQRDVSIYS